MKKINRTRNWEIHECDPLVGPSGKGQTISLVGVRGFLQQARIKFVCVWAQSSLTFSDPLDYSPPGSSVHGFSWQEDWRWCHFFPSGDLPDPGVEPTCPVSPALQADSLPTEPLGSPRVKCG